MTRKELDIKREWIEFLRKTVGEWDQSDAVGVCDAALAAFTHIDRLEREAKAGRELRDGLKLAVGEFENAKIVVSVCRASLLPTYDKAIFASLDTATKETDSE